MAKTKEREALDLVILESLTKAQWIEIYNALPAESDAHKAMKTDTRIESEGMKLPEIKRMAKHTRVIYNAVWKKINPWLYADDRKWRREMVELLEILAPFAYCEVCGAEAGDIPNDGGGLKVRGGDGPVTLHKWKTADGVRHRLCMVCRAGAKQSGLDLARRSIQAKAERPIPAERMSPKSAI